MTLDVVSLLGKETHPIGACSGIFVTLRLICLMINPFQHEPPIMSRFLFLLFGALED